MLEIKIDLDKKCKRCGKGGAGKGGYCLACVAKGIQEGKYDDIIKPLKREVKNVLKEKL